MSAYKEYELSVVIAAGRAPPSTVRGFAHDLTALFAVVDKDPVEVRATDALGFITARWKARAGSRERGADLRRRVRSLGGDDPSAAGGGVGILRLPRRLR